MPISTSFRETEVGKTGAWPCSAGVSSTPRTRAVKTDGDTFALMKPLDTAGGCQACPCSHPAYELEKVLEAPPGFEPGMEVLQTSALPLGDGAGRNQLGRGMIRPLAVSGDNNATIETGSWALRKWSGKRDSNPRLRPWQGRTLPLSYSRSRNPNRTIPPRRQTTRGPREPEIQSASNASG